MHEVFVGLATFIPAGSSESSVTPIQIKRVQGFHTLVIIERLGEGKVVMDRNGSFKGTWAMENRIFDVSGEAKGDRKRWTGRFTIYGIENGTIILSGSFKAERKP